MSEPSSGLVTLLFTDLEGSTELLARTGDTEVQRIFSAHHQALTYARRREPGDVQRAEPLLESAAKQFEVLGMTGWIRRAAQLEAELGGRQP